MCGPPAATLMGRDARATSGPSRWTGTRVVVAGIGAATAMAVGRAWGSPAGGDVPWAPMAVGCVSLAWVASPRHSPLPPVWRWFKQALVPEGYPLSVAPDYAEFQAWDSLQGVCSYVRGVLTSRTMLVAAGVGDAAASAVGAAATFALRDVTGNVGGFLFAVGMGKNGDGYPQRWRLAADAANDAALTVELGMPWLIWKFGPSAFPVCAVLSALLRSLVGVAGRASWAALTQHFATSGNHADLAAKEGTQETLASLVGMAIGWVCTVLLRGDDADDEEGSEAEHPSGVSRAELVVFVALTALHMYANWRAVSCVILNTLNRDRTSVLALHFVKSRAILTPAEVHAWRPRSEEDASALRFIRNCALGMPRGDLDRPGTCAGCFSFDPARGRAPSGECAEDLGARPAGSLEFYVAAAPDGRANVFLDEELVESSSAQIDYQIDCLGAAALMAHTMDRGTRTLERPATHFEWGPLSRALRKSGLWDTRRITIGRGKATSICHVDRGVEGKEWEATAAEILARLKETGRCPSLAEGGGTPREGTQ